MEFPASGLVNLAFQRGKSTYKGPELSGIFGNTCRGKVCTGTGEERSCMSNEALSPALQRMKPGVDLKHSNAVGCGALRKFILVFRQGITSLPPCLQPASCFPQPCSQGGQSYLTADARRPPLAMTFSHCT